MAEFAEANDVHHHVFMELHAVVQCQLGCQHHSLRIVTIDVQHGGFNHLDYIGAVQRGAAVSRVRGGKANLVVDHDVHRAARGVTTGLCKRQGFLNHTLTGKCRITVHQHWQDLLA